MKENKYAPYVLAPVLLLVWGLVFYKIYKAIYPDTMTPSPLPLKVNDISFQKEQIIDQTLLLNYEDPFLNRNIKNTHKETQIATKVTQQKSLTANSSQKVKDYQIPPSSKTITEKTVKFPKIIYQGFTVMDEDTMAILQMESNFYSNIRPGQYIGEIRIISIQTDYIKVAYQNELRVFPRLISLQIDN